MDALKLEMVSTRKWRAGWAVLALSALAVILLSCKNVRRAHSDRGRESNPEAISVMSLEDDTDEDFERSAFERYAAHTGTAIHTAQWPLSSASSRLAMYKELFRSRSPNPDLVKIDVIWAQELADDLIDLKPLLGKAVDAFSPELLANFTIGGRLVALPIFVDVGVLYCRRDLLKRYGYARPPETWEELEAMAQVIQDGERRRGNKNFWGYVWQGHAHEGLTCNALEWQASAGAGTIIEANGRVNVSNPRMVKVLKRALGWIGSISPPGENAYWESDSMYLWQSGNAAFMRNWASMYGMAQDWSDARHHSIQIAAVPAGENGHKGTLGGIAIGVSKYSRHQAEAVAALRFLTSEATQTERARQIGAIPTLTSLRQNEELMTHTPLGGKAADTVLMSVVARPSKVAGEHYDAVSQAYIRAVHSALTRKETPDAAMAELQTELTQIVGPGSGR